MNDRFILYPVVSQGFTQVLTNSLLAIKKRPEASAVGRGLERES